MYSRQAVPLNLCFAASQHFIPVCQLSPISSRPHVNVSYCATIPQQIVIIHYKFQVNIFQEFASQAEN